MSIQDDINTLIADLREMAGEVRDKVQAVINAIPALLNGGLALDHAAAGGATPDNTTNTSAAIHAIASNASALADAVVGGESTDTPQPAKDDQAEDPATAEQPPAAEA